MKRIIKESAECTVHYIFKYKDEIIFDEIINNSSLEYEYDEKREIDKTK